MRKQWAAGVLLALAMGVAAAPVERSAGQMVAAYPRFLCEVMKDPANYAGQRMRLEGVVRGSGPEQATLTSFCKESITLHFADGVKGNPDVRNLERAVEQEGQAAREREISAAMTGVFHYDARTQVAFFQVERVDKLVAPVVF